MGYVWARESQPGRDGTAEDEQWIEGIAQGKIAHQENTIVDEQNWEAFMLFLDCATQWRMITTFGPPVHQGIEYASLYAVMQMRRTKNKAEMFARVKQFERGAVHARLGLPLEDLIWPPGAAND